MRPKCAVCITTISSGDEQLATNDSVSQYSDTTPVHPPSSSSSSLSSTSPPLPPSSPSSSLLLLSNRSSKLRRHCPNQVLLPIRNTLFGLWRRRCRPSLPLPQQLIITASPFCRDAKNCLPRHSNTILGCIRISRGSVETHLRRDWNICAVFSWKSASERILKIG